MLSRHPSERKFSQGKERNPLGYTPIIPWLRPPFLRTWGELSLEQHRLQRAGPGGQRRAGMTKEVPGYPREAKR